MTTYKTLYHLMVQNMSEAIDLYDAGKGILAREVLKKALLDAEEQVILQDIIPDEPIGNGDPAELKKRHPKAASAAMPHRQKHGVDNPKRRGCAPPFWSLGGAGGEVETPPAFLLGDSKGEVLF